MGSWYTYTRYLHIDGVYWPRLSALSYAAEPHVPATRNPKYFTKFCEVSLVEAPLRASQSFHRASVRVSWVITLMTRSDTAPREFRT